MGQIENILLRNDGQTRENLSKKETTFAI